MQTKVWKWYKIFGVFILLFIAVTIGMNILILATTFYMIAKPEYVDFGNTDVSIQLLLALIMTPMNAIVAYGILSSIYSKYRYEIKQGLIPYFGDSPNRVQPYPFKARGVEPIWKKAIPFECTLQYMKEEYFYVNNAWHYWSTFTDDTNKHYVNHTNVRDFIPYLKDGFITGTFVYEIDRYYVSLRLLTVTKE